MVEDGRILCPFCYAPLQSMKPLHQRVMPVIAMALLIAVVTGIIIYTIRAW
jgi:hypothetical protein